MFIDRKLLQTFKWTEIQRATQPTIRKESEKDFGQANPLVTRQSVKYGLFLNRKAYETSWDTEMFWGKNMHVW